MNRSRIIRTAVLTLAVGLGGAAQGFAKAESSDKSEAVFATVNGEPILQSSYLTALRVAGRQRFYHGKPPEEALEAFREAAAAQCDSLGYEPAIVWVPHPIQDRTDEELRAIADEALEPVLAALAPGAGAG